MNVVVALLLIALGASVDAMYQRRIRIAECDAYETGYADGKREGSLRREEYQTQAVVEWPSMTAPVPLPDSFEDRLRKHGRATVKIK